MKTQNKAMLIGYLGTDPKIFETVKGHQFATFRMATDRYIQKDDKEKRKTTTWHQVKVWGKSRMDFISNNLMKGSHVMVEGLIDNYSITGNTGTIVHRTEIKAIHIMNLDR